jgi:hypothetical protein
LALATAEGWSAIGTIAKRGARGLALVTPQTTSDASA